MNNGFRSIAILVSFLMAGCGGGGGGGVAAPAGTAEGFWEGTTGDGRSVQGVVLDDGTYWVIYYGINDDSFIAGVVQGSGNSSDGNFSSSNARDFNFEGLGTNDATVSANYAQMQTFDGTVNYGPGNSSIFNLAYDSLYDLTPSLATISGTYLGQAVTADGYDTATVTIASDGSLTTISDLGCQATGTVTPRANGNVYNISVTFLGGNCSNGTSTVTGVVVYNAGVVTSAALNSARTNGFLFLGATI